MEPCAVGSIMRRHQHGLAPVAARFSNCTCLAGLEARIVRTATAGVCSVTFEVKDKWGAVGRPTITFDVATLKVTEPHQRWRSRNSSASREPALTRRHIRAPARRHLHRSSVATAKRRNGP